MCPFPELEGWGQPHLNHMGCKAKKGKKGWMSFLSLFVKMEIVICTGDVLRAGRENWYPNEHLFDAYHGMPGAFLSILHIPTHLIFWATLGSRNHYYLNFTDKGTQAQSYYWQMVETGFMQALWPNMFLTISGCCLLGKHLAQVVLWCVVETSLQDRGVNSLISALVGSVGCCGIEVPHLQLPSAEGSSLARVHFVLRDSLYPVTGWCKSSNACRPGLCRAIPALELPIRLVNMSFCPVLLPSLSYRVVPGAFPINSFLHTNLSLRVYNPGNKLKTASCYSSSLCLPQSLA